MDVGSFSWVNIAAGWLHGGPIISCRWNDLIPCYTVGNDPGHTGVSDEEIRTRTRKMKIPFSYLFLIGRNKTLEETEYDRETILHVLPEVVLTLNLCSGW